MIEIGKTHLINPRHIMRADICDQTLVIWLVNGERIQFGGDDALKAWELIKDTAWKS